MGGLRHSPPIGAGNDSRQSDEHTAVYQNPHSVQRIVGPDGSIYHASTQPDSSYEFLSMAQQLLMQPSGEPPADPHLDHDLFADSHTSNDQNNGNGDHSPGWNAVADSVYEDPPNVPSNDTIKSPVSSTSTVSVLARRTRSGGIPVEPSHHLVIRAAGSKGTKISKVRVRAARKKREDPDAPRLHNCLSVLTEYMGDDPPVRDMDAYVHRSIEMRKREVEKKNNHVGRPMNSFMLYRSAYSERTKAWCKKNNHQLVSTVSGQSWPMEPDSLKDKYAELARIERENHAKAFPSYKFRPSKCGPSARRRMRETSGLSDSDNVDDDGASNVSDNDDEYRPSAGVGRQAVARRSARTMNVNDQSFLPSQDWSASPYETHHAQQQPNVAVGLPMGSLPSPYYTFPPEHDLQHQQHAQQQLQQQQQHTGQSYVQDAEQYHFFPDSYLSPNMHMQPFGEMAGFAATGYNMPLDDHSLYSYAYPEQIDTRHQYVQRSYDHLLMPLQSNQHPAMGFDGVAVDPQLLNRSDCPTTNANGDVYTAKSHDGDEIPNFLHQWH